MPAYVEREFRRYLECGVPANGCTRARCVECGHVFPPLPVRQWVLSVPERLRWYPEHEPQAHSAVLHIFLHVVEMHLLRVSDATSPRARLGEVSFVHRLKASLNRHGRYQCGILDGELERLDDGLPLADHCVAGGRRVHQ